MTTEHDLRIIWYDVAPPATLGPPFTLELKTDAHALNMNTFSGLIVVHCRYTQRANGSKVYISNRYGCLRVENVPLTKLEELSENFLMLAEARYGV